MFQRRLHAVGIGRAFDTHSRMAQIDIDDAGPSGLSSPTRDGGFRLRRCITDLNGKQDVVGCVRNFQMSCAVLPPPFEHLVRIHVVRTRNQRYRRARFQRLFYDRSSLLL